MKSSGNNSGLLYIRICKPVLLTTSTSEGKCTVYNRFIYNSNLKIPVFMRKLYKSWYKQCIISVRLNLGERSATPSRKDGSRFTDRQHHRWLPYLSLMHGLMEDKCIHTILPILRYFIYIHTFIWFFFASGFRRKTHKYYTCIHLSKYAIGIEYYVEWKELQLFLSTA